MVVNLSQIMVFRYQYSEPPAVEECPHRIEKEDHIISLFGHKIIENS
jgi:hypothetical protein